MQQILKFEIELFDVRTKQSTKIVDDRDYVRGIQIKKDIYLNNQATIVFNKSKSYKNSAIEEKMKLYNYAKIKLTTKNYDNTNFVSIKSSNSSKYEHTYYFSGFITNINKAFTMNDAPTASISLTISDFSNLFKTTFYTKNLIFLDILNQAVPEFRLLNFNDVLGDVEDKLKSSAFTPNQMGFLFFAFLFFKFMANITKNEDGSDKTDSSSLGESKTIFKNFRIFMPFDLSIPGADSIFATQAQTLILYKQFQGTAYELFKYLYPEPIFEFNTYENEKSVVLIIRPTPFMAFDRAFVTNLGKVEIVQVSGTYSDNIEKHEIESPDFDVDSYNVIESDDFGFRRVQNVSSSGSSVAQYMRFRVEKPVISKIQDFKHSKTIDVLGLLPSGDESSEIESLFYNIYDFDISFIESLSMNRSAQSVVNVIWTTPVTDTSLLNLSGRTIVFAKMQEELNKLTTKTFNEYVYNQFLPGKNYNPVFLWNYQNQFPNAFISGDINYFGIREFEVRWNFMTLYENIISIVARNINKNVLKTIVDSNKGKTFVDDLYAYIQDDSPYVYKKGKVPTIDEIRREAFNQPTVAAYDWAGKSKNLTKRDVNSWLIRNAYSPPLTLANEKVLIKGAINDPAFITALQVLGFSPKDIEDVKSLDKLVDLLKIAKEKSVYHFGEFTKIVNGVVSRAYRENEHLYDMNLLTVVNTSIMPGMIINSTHKNPEYNRPRFRGYVSGITHILDFNAASLKTNITMTRTASNDSSGIRGQ